jgi:replicative DNA helicase
MSNLDAPLHSVDAEEACLGSVLKNPDCYRDMAPYISADDFYIVRNKWVYVAIEDMVRKHTEIDIITVSEHLEESGKLKELGGKAYLLQLINNTPTSMHAEHYAKIVMNMSKRRNMLQAANDLAKSAYNLETDLDTLIPGHITTVLKNLKVDNKTEHLSVGLGKLWDDIVARRENPRQIFGLQTGLQKLDEITGGAQKREIMMITGEPGLGKSLLTMQMVVAMAKAGHAGVIYQLEMSQMNTLRRTLSNESAVEARKMKTGYVNDKEMQDIGEAIAGMESLPIFISNSTSWTTSGIRADITRLKQDHCIEWFLIDYLGKLKDRHDGKDFERIGIMGSALHDTAMELDVAGLVIHTMNKAGYNETPGMEALSGDTKTGYDPDVAIFLTRDQGRQKPGQVQEVINLSFGKFREGSTADVIKLVRKQNFPAFEEQMKYC